MASSVHYPLPISVVTSSLVEHVVRGRDREACSPEKKRSPGLVVDLRDHLFVFPYGDSRHQPGINVVLLVIWASVILIAITGMLGSSGAVALRWPVWHRAVSRVFITMVVALYLSWLDRP